MAYTTNLFSRGSEWRRWDLHVHSPASANFSGTWRDYVVQLGNSDCAAIGINDYFSVAGYVELRRRLDQPTPVELQDAEYAAAREKLLEKALLPVVECRMTNVVIGKKGSGQRVNFHLIFSDELNPADIESLIRGFEVKNTTIGSSYTDSKFLLDEAQVDFFSIKKRLDNDTRFKDKFAIWIPYNEYGGIADIDPKTDKLLKEGLISAAHILGSSNKKQAEFFLWKDEKYTEEQFQEWFDKRKPCVKGSDSHRTDQVVGRLKDHESKPTDNSCWIKADPTFKGLLQIINEPADRVFLGKEPPKLARVRSHSTNFLSHVRIAKTATASTDQVWFDSDLPLNHDMVAIIGNKGSGKSALADVLALAGDTTQHEHFSFLQKRKFREKRLAANYAIEATWANGAKTVHNLQDDPNPSKPELIKYISQSYLERVCTETSPDEGSEFQKELRNVIFSHISPEQKLGKTSLEELIGYKTEEINANIERLKTKLSQHNIAIAKFRVKRGSRV